MNPPFSESPPPPAMQFPSKKPFPVIPVVFGVVVLLIALGAVAGISIFRAVKADSTAAIAVGNRFLDDMGKHDYASARSLFTPAVQTKTSASNLSDIESLVEKHKGAYVAHGQPQWNVSNWNGQTRVALTYPAQFANGADAVTMVLVQTKGGCQVFEAHYDL